MLKKLSKRQHIFQNLSRLLRSSVQKNARIPVFSRMLIYEKSVQGRIARCHKRIIRIQSVEECSNCIEASSDADRAHLETE